MVRDSLSYPMEILWWTLSLLLMLIGLAGVVVPLIPGAVLIFAGALVHRLGLGAEASVSWWTLGGLLLLTAIAYALEFFAGSIGAKYFGATRWGIIGGLVGGVIGIFFGLPGLIVGPLMGVMVGELYAGRHIRDATRSTWGTLLGGAAGLVVKLAISFAMIAWFALALVL